MSVRDLRSLSTGRLIFGALEQGELCELSEVSMTWVVNTVLVLEVLLLLYVAAADVAARVIRNEVCLALALLGIVGQLENPSQVPQSLIVASILFVLLFLIYMRGWMG